MTRLLYVEDEPFLAKIVQESLEGRGYAVTLVTDGSNALPAFRQTPPDLVLLDVMLPGKDGWTIGREIRKLSPHVPIIFLTAKNQTEDVLRGFQSGANDYVRKPFSVEELVARIENQLLRLPTVTDPDEGLVLGNFRWFARQYRLVHPQKERTLSHREAELFQLLIDHRDGIAERRTILKKIWGDDSFVNSRNLDVYITKLRRYLKLDSSVKIITLKGVGYRLTF